MLINGGIFVFAVYWASKSTYSPWQPLMLGILIFFIRANYKVSKQLRGGDERDSAKAQRLHSTRHD